MIHTPVLAEFGTCFGRREGGGRRSAGRSEARVTAIARTLIATRSVELGDVSATGAKLLGQDLPKVGDELFLRIRGVETFGHVVWREAASAGVAFDEPLTTSELTAVRNEGARTNLMRLTPAQVDALDQWVVGSR